VFVFDLVKLRTYLQILDLAGWLSNDKHSSLFWPLVGRGETSFLTMTNRTDTPFPALSTRDQCYQLFIGQKCWSGYSL